MDVINQRAHEIKAAAVAALPLEVGRVVFAPGELAAWDDCCNGQLAIRLVQVTPVFAGQPQPNCPPQPVAWNATYGLSVTRCAAVVNDNGQPPSPSQIDADSTQMTEDMQALMGVICNLPDLWNIEQWRPEGPDGGCTGGEWIFTIRV